MLACVNVREGKITRARHTAVRRDLVVGLPGFEPRLREPKPLVLPLHHSPIRYLLSQGNLENCGAKVQQIIKN